jgi:ribosomal-protein-alanine N-acetyltransferase
MEAAMARFLGDNYPGHLERWSPPAAPAFFTEAYWRERLVVAVEEFHAGRVVRFVFHDENTGESADIVGTCSYTSIVRGPFHACNLGYQLARTHEGRGLMAEALEATNAFAFRTLRLHRIMASHRPENARSERVLGRLGFAREGLAKDYLFIDGAWRDHVLHSLVNPEFDPAWIEPAGRS